MVLECITVARHEIETYGMGEASSGFGKGTPMSRDRWVSTKNRGQWVMHITYVTHTERPYDIWGIQSGKKQGKASMEHNSMQQSTSIE